MGPVGAERRLAAILSADIVGFSRLMAEDEDATVRTRAGHRGEIERLLREHRGRLVDFRGDDFLAEFSSAVEAVQCAVGIQRALENRNAELPLDRQMMLRIGIHVGDVRVEGAQILGDGVNIAARLESIAESGGVCVSAAVHEQVRRKVDLRFEDLGPRDLKNIPDPVHAYFARWVGAALAPTVRTESPARAVAVLAFDNMSADPDQEYFGDGIAEELINALTHVGGLRVIARTSAFSFKGTKLDIQSIGRKLGVGSVVEGSVRKAGNRVRITAQLIDVAGGHHLWSETYDRSLDDIFEIQDEIARTIVSTIRPKLLGARPLVERATASQEAYELFLRATERLARIDRRNTEAAIELLEEATRIDPDYADAWARLAGSYSQMEVAFDPDVRWHERAERAVKRAFELDSDHAEAHYAHGRILWSPREGFQHRPALRAFQRAVAVQPGSHPALVWRGTVLTHIGLMEEALQDLSEALSAQPDDAFTLVLLSQTSLFLGRYEDAAEYMARSLSADPTALYSQLNDPIVGVYLGDLDRSERALQRAREVLGSDPLLDAGEALLWAKRGEAERADAALVRALEERPSLSHTHHTWHHAAAALAILGRSGEAIRLLRRASRNGLPNHPAFLTDPCLRSLQEVPEMKEFLADLEQEHAAHRREFGRAT